MYNDIIMLMQRWKRSRYLYILGIAIASLIAGTISPIIPTALADTLTPARVNFEDKNLPFVRINRTVIKVGEAFFYSDDPTREENNSYTAVGLDCPAKLTYNHETVSSEGGSDSTSSWTIKWQRALESQSGCNSADVTTKRNDDPKNNGEDQRYYTVFYFSKDGKINSVLHNNSTTFTMKGQFNANDTYVEDGKQPIDCPSIIRNSGDRWAYIPMHKVDKAENGSDQYASLMSKITGVAKGDFACNPVGNGPDKDAAMTRFGLPGSYYDRGITSKNDVSSNFGFSGADLHGALLKGGVPYDDAEGISANGRYEGGKKVGNGKGVQAGSEGSSEGKTTCAVEGIGWIVCPVLTFLGGITDNAYNIISDAFLTLDTDLISTSSDTYTAWKAFRNIANVVFVIVFIIIIYSQITSAGITNYGIKKMLPRLIVGAILVNVSFFLCQLAVDISQIIGYNVKALFDTINNATAGTAAGSGQWSTIGQGLTWTAIFATALVTAVLVALSISIPVVLASLFAVLMIVLILMGRKAIIILLVILSPIAFVAYLLPNTEKWFKKWWDMFSTLLMLFPIIGLVFGASKLAGNILAKASSNDILLQVTAMGVATIPFFVVPNLLKGALAAAGSIGAKLQGLTNAAGKQIGSAAKNKSRLGTAMQDISKYREQKRAIKYARGRGGGMIGAIGRRIGGKEYEQKVRLRANTLENEEYENDVKAADQMLLSRSYADKQRIASGEIDASEAERDAAVRFIISNGNFNERRDVLASAATMTDRQRRSAVNGARAKGDTGVYGSKTLGDIEEGRFTTVPEGQQANSQHINNQLNAGAVDRIEKGEAAPETFTRDSYTAEYMANRSKSASADAQQRFASSLSSYASTDQGQKIPTAVRQHIDSVAGNTPTANTPPTPQPQSAPPIQSIPQSHPQQTQTPPTQVTAPQPQSAPPAQTSTRPTSSRSSQSTTNTPLGSPKRVDHEGIAFEKADSGLYVPRGK